MPRVWRLRNVVFASLVALAAVLAFMPSAKDSAEAAPFSPTFVVTLSDTTVGANADVRETFGILVPDAFFGLPDPILLMPKDPAGSTGWPTPNYAGTLLGADVGSGIAASTLGLLNGPCASPVPVNFAPFMNATTSLATSDGDPHGATFDVWTGFGDGDATTGPQATPGQPAGSEPVKDGLPDAVTRYPLFLESIAPQASTGGAPLARLHGQVLNLAGITGTHVALTLMIYNPGQLAGAPWFVPASSGYPMLVILENSSKGDATGPSNPSAVTDVCSKLDVTLTRLGVSVDNPSTTTVNEGGTAILTNPTTAGAYTFNATLTSWPDADNDGIDNDLDNCPFVPNIESPRLGAPQGDPDGDGIDSACEAFNPANSHFLFTDVPCVGVWLAGGTCALTAAPWQPSGPGSRCRFGGADDGAGLDCDMENQVPGRAFLNRDDKCPQMIDLTPGYPAPGSPDNSDVDGDQIGDQCDIGAGPETACLGPVFTPYQGGAFVLPTVDNDFDMAINDGCPASGAPEVSQCTETAIGGVGLGVDDDGDGVADDGCWGGPPLAPAAVGPREVQQCSDGIDNDGDGLVNDGCPVAGGSPTVVDGHIHSAPLSSVATLLATHDIAIQKVTGNLKVKAGQTKGYSLHLFNGGPSTEVIPYLIAAIPVPFLSPGPPPGGAACPRPGIDTQADGNLDGADDSFPAFVNLDPFPDSVAIAASIPTPSGVPSGNDFQMIYGTCPAAFAPLAVEYTMRLDACHSGDAAPLGFFGAACPTVQAPDGGVDPNFANDGPVLLPVDDKTH